MKSAQELAIASLEAIKSKQRALWLSLFSEDAIVEDPVGKSPFDPLGMGHKGHAAIGRFYDTVVSRNEAFDYQIRESYACGNEVASAATFIIGTAEGGEHSVDLITIHKVNDAGKLCSLRAFWTFPA